MPREDPPDSVSIFGSLGFRLLKPGLVVSNRCLYPTCGVGPKESNKVRPKQFKTDLQNYYLTALGECFNEEDPRTWKTICLKCNTSRYLRSKVTCCF